MSVDPSMGVSPPATGTGATTSTTTTPSTLTGVVPVAASGGPTQFMAQPEAMRAAAGNLGGIVMQAASSVLELEHMIVAPPTFAAIGTSVASANTTMQAHQTTALSSLLTLLQDVNKLITIIADAYELADKNAATGYGGTTTPATTTAATTASLWSNVAGTQLADQALAGAGGTPTPHNASTVIGYMSRSGLGQLGTQGTGTMPTGSVASLTSWLDASPANQVWAGVVGVYNGSARSLADVPGGVQPGDVVIVDPGAAAADQQPTIGVVGGGDQLFNNGAITPDFGGTASIQVFRPLPTPAATTPAPVVTA